MRRLSVSNTVLLIICLMYLILYWRSACAPIGHASRPRRHRRPRDHAPGDGDLSDLS
jgi:hypothetical protein